MTPNRYSELIGFLGQKFEGLESRLDRHDRQFVEVRRHATTLFEQAAAERRVMMEGIDARFEVVNGRLDGMDQRFDGIDRRLDGIDGRLDGIDQRLDGMDQHLDGIDRRLDGMDGRWRGDSWGEGAR